MPEFRRDNLKYTIDEGFFRKWSKNMSYILGFSYADGSLYKTTLSWDIQTRDLELLQKINRAFKSTYPVEKRLHSVRLRVSNQMFIEGAKSRGLIGRKAARIRLPNIPKIFIRHFIRGFLDGDGWVVKRNNRNEVDIGFVCKNEDFLKDLLGVIFKETGLKSRVRVRNKVTASGLKSRLYAMEYYSNNAMRLGHWLYKDLDKSDIYLKRKYTKHNSSIDLYKYLNSGSREVRKVQKKLNRPMAKILGDLYTTQHLSGIQISKILKVHSSSIYRWLAKEGIRYPLRRSVVYE